jgi:hypothetical protein
MISSLTEEAEFRDVAHALLRAASRLISTPADPIRSPFL